MTLSAVMLGALGIACIFLPQELASALGLPESGAIAIQMLGALYFGFTMLNWTAKSNLLGGIYGRSIVFGNLAHFVIGALTLLKFITKETSGVVILIFTLIYALFAILFGVILFRHPVKAMNEPVAED